ncbi:MAG TPA: hypothetical protein GXX41_12875 [Thermoanaerobacterium sp.]|nr:hypothetical protein [Thermoanaerobacterium sp.]
MLNCNFTSCSFAKRTLFALPGYILFFMMLFVPTVYQPIKAVLLALVLTVICLSALIKKKISLHPLILLWILFITSVGLFFILRGLIYGAPGALRVGTVYVLWPLVYMILVAGISNITMLENIIRVLTIAAIAICIYSFSYIFYAIGWLPSYLYIPINLGQAIGFYSGYIEYNLYNISSLIFLVPFFIAALITWPKNIKMPVSRFWLWIGFLLGVSLVFLSGRRALILVTVLSPIITLFFRFFSSHKIKLANRKVVVKTFVTTFILVLVILFFLNYVYGINISVLVDIFFEGFDFQRSPSALARKTQFFALLDGWSQHPLLGAGHGAGVAYKRSIEQPWAYELFYIALLYQTGIIGFIIYISAVIWIFWYSIHIIKSNLFLSFLIIPVLVGMVCFLIANATNPYLGKYDYLWVIFLPAAFINCWLLSPNDIKKQVSH